MSLAPRNRQFSLLGAAMVVVALQGCNRDSSPHSSSTETVGQSSPHEQPSEAPGSASSGDDQLASVHANEARQLLGAWLAAQNAGDFAAYRSLYATKFTGVRRSAQREVTLGRASWMQERAKMFQKPMTVTAEEVSVSPGTGVVVLLFRQRWSNGSYQDEGRKQLVVLKEAGKLRIAREEMLSSHQPQQTLAEAVPWALSSFALAEPSRDGVVLLLDDAPQVAWATDHPIYLSNQRAQRAVHTPALPNRLRDLLDQQYEVFTSDGGRCRATARGFQLMVHVRPNFGTVDTWEDVDAKFQQRDAHPIAVEQRAVELWRMATSLGAEGYLPGLVLGLELNVPDECKETVWGRGISLAGTPKGSGEKLASPWMVLNWGDASESLLTAVEHHPLVRSLDHKARKSGETNAKQRWLDSVDIDSARLIRGPGGIELAYVSVYGVGGCGVDTPPQMSLLFRRQGDKLVPLRDRIYLEGPLRGAIDWEGDGVVELVGSESLLVREKAGYVHRWDVSGVSLECGC